MPSLQNQALFFGVNQEESACGIELQKITFLVLPLFIHSVYHVPVDLCRSRCLYDHAAVLSFKEHFIFEFVNCVRVICLDPPKQMH